MLAGRGQRAEQGHDGDDSGGEGEFDADEAAQLTEGGGWRARRPRCHSRRVEARQEPEAVPGGAGEHGGEDGDFEAEDLAVGVVTIAREGADDEAGLDGSGQREDEDGDEADGGEAAGDGDDEEAGAGFSRASALDKIQAKKRRPAGQTVPASR